MRNWRKAALLGIGLLLSNGPAGWIAPQAVLGTVAGVAIGGYSDSAQARASSSSSRSSGGYSRPSSSSSSRTPSFSAPSSSSSSSSGSGGYRRPSLAPSSDYSAPAPSRQSASDRELSRSQSGQALDQYRKQQAPPPAAAAPTYQPPASSPVPQTRRSGQSDGWSNPGWNSGGSWGGNRSSGPSYPPTYPPGAGWGGNWAPGRGWALPGYAYNTPRRFGIWDGLFLWFVLDNLTRPGYADFFHNHRSDPGYEQWRAEAEQRAKSDADLRAKLNDLDAKLTEKRGQPVDPAYLPPDVPREVAVAEGGGPGEPPPSKSRVGFGLILAVVLLAFGALVVLWLARRRRAAGVLGSNPSTSPASQAGNILKQAVSDVPYKPSLFRIGMTLTADPTPFILAGTATKVSVPEIAEAAGGLVSVGAVGKLDYAGTELNRLYLPGGRTLFQLHLGPDGHPDECRCFSLLDEINPASAEEWGFWLDPAEGMIGWPEFQTKDGKLYARQWAPGPTRVEPRRFAETLTDVNGTRTRQVQAMLYSAPTGAAAPAPETEYLLVSAIEEGGRAWVELHAGIAVNPASLSLA